MRVPLIFSFALLSTIASPSFAQEKLPARFQALAKDGPFRLMRVMGMPEMHPIVGHRCAFSADGKTAVYAEDISTYGQKPSLRTRLSVWTTQTSAWPRAFEFAGKVVTALDVSEDGSNILIAGEDESSRGFLLLWDSKLGKEIKTILHKEKASAPCYQVALSSDSGTALAYHNSALKRWDLKTGTERTSYGTDVSGIGLVLSMPDGKHFLATRTSKNGAVEIQLWSVDSTKPIRSFVDKKNEERLASWAAARDGKRFVSGNLTVADFAPTITLWEIDTGKRINTLKLPDPTFERFVDAVAVAEDGKTVLSVWSKGYAAAGDFQCARLIAWDGETNKILWSHVVPYRGSVPMLVQGDKLLIGGGPNPFDTWSIKDGKLLSRRGGHKSPINAVAVLPDGDILSAGNEGILMTWRKGQVVRAATAHLAPITALALSKKGDQWLSAGADLSLRHWRTDGIQPYQLKKSHTGPITSLAFSSQAGWACSGSGDRSVKTWNLAAGKEIATITGHSEGVNAVAVTLDDRWIASAGDDTTIRLTPIKDGKLDPGRETIVLEGHKKPVTSLAFSQDGKSLISGSQDQTLKVWDWSKGNLTRTITGHKNWVTSILVLDADSMLTTSDDLSLCRWELATGKEMGRIDFGALGDCPRCVARLGTDRVLVGSSSWLIYEFQIMPAGKSAGASESSNK